MAEKEELKRSVSLAFLIFYGIGTMVGGGFYALLGKVSAESAYYTPFALGLAGLFALITGLSFAELSSRFPVSAGEVRYVSVAFNRAWFSRMTGFFVILTGVVSTATLSVATIGFLQDFFDVSQMLSITLLVLAMGAIASWGIGQSVLLVAIITFVEVGALIYAFSIADGSLIELSTKWRQFVPSLEATAWIGTFSGAFLAFYAFLGFEDMVNIAEEVKKPKKNLPIAIIVSTLLTTLIYVLVSLSALLSVPLEQLAASNTPVAEMVKSDGWYSTTGLTIVSLLAGINGALVQMIMASRVAYGMAKRDHLPLWFAKVNPKTQTPLHATFVVAAAVLILALLFPLVTLAKITSGIVILVFSIVNLALYTIKRKDPDLDADAIRLPIWLPLLGGLSCLLVLGFQLYQG